MMNFSAILKSLIIEYVNTYIAVYSLLRASNFSAQIINLIIIYVRKKHLFCRLIQLCNIIYIYYK